MTRWVLVALAVGGCGRIGFVFDQVCGNGELDAGEQCDDGNILAGDGCGRTCVIEPGFECPILAEPCLRVVGLNGSAGTALTSVGGGGGLPFLHECGPGQAIVGIEAGILDGNLTMTRVACAPIAFAADGALQQGGVTLTLAEGNGTPNGGQGVGSCASDALVVGYSAKSSVNNFVAGIQLACQSFAHVGGELVIGGEGLTSVIGDIVPPSVNERCPGGSVAAAFLGRSGVVTDQVTLRCDAIAVVLCGDGVRTAPETCDDGNPTAGDGCDARCQLE